MESSSDRIHCFVWSSNSTERQKYFSARIHIVWHSSSVILLKISTSNGPPNRLFSSLTNTASPSHRLSAAIKVINGKLEQTSFISFEWIYHSNKCFPSNQSSDLLSTIPDAFALWIGSVHKCVNSYRSLPIGKQMSIRLDIYLHNRIY